MPKLNSHQAGAGQGERAPLRILTPAGLKFPAFVGAAMLLTAPWVVNTATGRDDAPVAVGAQSPDEQSQHPARSIRSAAEAFPVGRLELNFTPGVFPLDAFEASIETRIRSIIVSLAEGTGADGQRVLEHPRLVNTLPGGRGTLIDFAPFSGEPINAAITRGALLAIDTEIRRILSAEFGLIPGPGLGLDPRDNRFLPAGADPGATAESDLLEIPASLLGEHGEGARWVWTRFHRDSHSSRDPSTAPHLAAFPDLVVTIPAAEFGNSLYPTAWRGARFDVGAFQPSLVGLPADAAMLDSLRDIRVELGLIGSDQSPLFVYPGTGGERVLVRVFDADSARGTYTPGALVAIDAAVRTMMRDRFGIDGVILAPTMRSPAGESLWDSRPLPVSAAAGQAGFTVLEAPDATGAERTWTLFYQDQRSGLSRFEPGAPLPPLAIDVLGNSAHPLIDGDPDTQRFRVARVEFVYPDLGGGLHPDLPPIEQALARIAVPLTRVQEPAPGWIAARPGGEAELIPLLDLVFDPKDDLYASAIRSISLAVQVAYRDIYGWVGHFVQPDPRQIDPARAMRSEEGDTLRIWIQSIEVDEVRTVARAENARIREGQPSVNNRIHRGIVDRSPVRPRQLRLGDYREGEAAGDLEVVPGSIPRFRDLEEYAARLNRHPGRRVDPVVTPGAGPGLVGIDYLVNEVKPWLVLGEVSNTGTEETDEWRYRIGVLHTQLTGADDILQIDYLTAGFDESHAVIASYQRPIIPDKLWFRMFGNWSEYTASDVGLAGINFEGESYQFGGELILNVFQHRDLFIDVIGGARYENVEVFNGAADETGKDDYTVLYAGARLERSSALASSFASVRLETSVGDLDVEEAQLLGRSDPSRSWSLLRYDASHSFFLEPILNPGGFSAQSGREEEMTLAHQIALIARGQVSFNDRLLPNEQQTAGGFFTVRGYPESLLAGDSVHLFSGEYRFYLVRSLPAVGIGRDEVAQPFGNFQFRRTSPYGAGDWDLLFRAFADYAVIRASDATNFELEDELFGIGIGAELLVKNNLSIRLDWGFAINEIETATENVDRWDNRLHFSATVRF